MYPVGAQNQVALPAQWMRLEGGMLPRLERVTGLARQWAGMLAAQLPLPLPLDSVAPVAALAAPLGIRSPAQQCIP